MEGDLHFSGWEASLGGKETREEGYSCALNELSLCVSDSPRDAFRREASRAGVGMVRAEGGPIQLVDHTPAPPT